MYYTFFFLIVLCFLYYTLYRKPKILYERYIKLFEQNGYKVYQIPYNPFKATLIEQIKKCASKYLDVYKIYRIDTQGYDVIVANSLTKPWITLLNPQLIKQYIPLQRDFLYEKELMFINPAKRTIGEGVLFSETTTWARKRKILNKVFKFDYIKSLHELIIQRCQKGFEIVQSDTSKDLKRIPGLNEKNINICDLAFYVAETTIMESFMGKEATKSTIDEMRISQFSVKLTDDYLTSVMTDFISLALGEKFEKLNLRAKDRYFNKQIYKLNDWIRSYVHQRKRQEEQKIQQLGDKYQGKDIFSIIIQQNKQNQKQSKSHENYSEAELVNQFKTFLFAGTDSTATTINVMVFNIVKYPEIQAKIRKQIQQNLGSKANFTFQDLKKCEYLQAVQKESLRMYGPINFMVMRVSTKDHYFADIPIVQNTIMSYHSIAFHYSQNIYKQANKFRPQRWLNGQCSNLNPFDYITFHSGNRSCIDKHLALLESKIVVAMVFQRYSRIDIADDKLIFDFKSIGVSRPYESIVCQ